MAGERLREALRMYRKQYRKADRAGRTALLDEFCRLSRYHRKYAITLLGQFHEDVMERPRRRRGPTYSNAALRVIEAVWKASGYPWSERLKALLPLWMPWAKAHLKGITEKVEQEVLGISARQMDRRLAGKKRRLKRRCYGRTKPGTLLKHQIPIKAGPWEVSEPGYAEIDLVSHSGPSAQGEFGYTLNLTDVHTGWCESRAILGRGQEGVVAALDAIRRSLPFPLRAIDSDNGSEFINYHLVVYCQEHDLVFTRGRPYKKDDNAHIEQKNWTHVRRIFGWQRYDRPNVIAAMNDLYEKALRIMMNLFQPSVKLVERKRVGGRLRRRYDAAKTPLDRLVEGDGKRALPGEVRALVRLRQRTDPFALAQAIEGRLDRLEDLRSERAPRRLRLTARRPAPLSPQGGRASLELAHAR
jgi:hypothetical protein